jgi:phage terminase large subunit-like protein
LEENEKRIGRQTPTVSRVLPYTDTRGIEAVLLYNQSRRKAQEWQELTMCDIMAQNSDGQWTHMKFGWSVPRQNGKSELLIMRAIWGLTHGERVLYTAHLVNTSHAAWEKTAALLEEMGFTENDDFKRLAQKGAEVLEWLHGDGGRINFRTRTVRGGLGETYDLLIIDEAQEYTADQEGAIKHVITASPNPQTLMCGTPPTMISKGTVFTAYRGKVLSGEEEDAGWAEWSVPQMSDTRDVDLWYETNPSLGLLTTERTIRNSIGSDTVDDNIQRLGLWLLMNLHSAISEDDWDTCKLDGKPEISGEPALYMGVKYAKDGVNVSAAVAVRLDGGRVFVEALDCRPARNGNSWIIAFLQNPHFKAVAVDGANGQRILADEITDAELETPVIFPKVSDITTANALFEQELFGDHIRHSGQPSLRQIASNCEHRAIGTSGGFGYKSLLDGADVSILEAVSLAHWLCATAKEDEPQMIYC